MNQPALKTILGHRNLASTLCQPAQPMRLERARANIEHQLGSVVAKQPSVFDLLDTYRALRRAQVAGSTLASLDRRHLRRGPWVLLQPMEKDTPALAEDASFLDRYFAELSRRGTPRTVGTLGHVYLRDYPRSLSGFASIQRYLKHELAKRDSPRIRRFRQRCEQFSLLEQDGPTRYAAMLDAVPDAASLASRASLEGELADQGFIVDAARAWLALIQDRLSNLTDSNADKTEFVERCLAFFQASDKREGLRFPSLRVALANALLLPFESRTPSADTRSRIESFLLDRYCDPRLERGQWHGVDDRARNVLLRWLVNATLMDFFRIVRHASKHDRDADRMWPFREAFWTAYLNKGVISDAWVVLGSQVRDASRQMLSRMDSAAYGELASGGGSFPNHAVLILRIADLVITEWSHSGKYRLWHVNDEAAPRFYRPRYQRSHLVRGSALEGSHHHAEGGSWQRRLAEEIQNRTGIRITQKEFMPRG